MQARFLLGPAGVGKTFRCLEEIRAALRENPQGAPLILLAPKQATFQLERQLLGEPALSGYTRLHILSFERLAGFVFRQWRVPPPRLLSEEGRIMVLRALLNRRRADLKIFRSCPGLAGFAGQLSLELRELQRRQISPDRLAELALRPDLTEPLRLKLHDLALLQRAYFAWLDKENLRDADCLLDFATRALQQPNINQVSISSLWLDGFAEMTPQELSLLAALAPHCQSMTLAFCVEENQSESPGSWLSIWSTVTQTQHECWKRISRVPGARCQTEILRRRGEPGRFARSAVLRHVEQHWANPRPLPNSAWQPDVRAALCADPEQEAVLAAREILRFVRGGGRFREAAVLLRGLEGYHDVLRRIFSRYEIPFFLDRREPVAHHPLAELTRQALRVVAFDWRHDDWFGALKTGLVSPDDEAIDRLENEALANGWTGQTWTTAFPNDDGKMEMAERLRQKWVAPFLQLKQDLSRDGQLQPTGAQLAQALREFWNRLEVEQSLAAFADAAESSQSQISNPQSHATVWQQMNAWLDALALAFAGESLPLAEWLAILEAGLGGLTVGVVPLRLDQVLIGAVDRSRNPDLKLALLLGVNESVFPAASPPPSLLTESDCSDLRECGVVLGPSIRQFLSREQFLGYIACTRARQRLVVTCAQSAADNRALNPSPFFSHLKRLLPQLILESFSASNNLPPEHACEMMPAMLRLQAAGGNVDELLAGPAYASARARIKFFAPRTSPEKLSPALARRLYGPALRTSVSRLEQFAGCAFRFFVHSGLRAEERRSFELDSRQKGSFQHAVLARFHQQLHDGEKTWHDLTSAEARRLLARVSAELIPQFEQGLLRAEPASHFAARTMARSLEDFVAATVEWMGQYEFEPSAVEVEFGGAGGWPAWELDLGSGLRLAFAGRIDRIDLCSVNDTALAVVIDYKSSRQKLDSVLMRHGVQLQLPAYLAVLRHLPEAAKISGARRLVPAGVFYVNFRGNFESGETRTDVLQNQASAWQAAFRHFGRFDLSALPHLDNRGEPKGTQFNFRLKRDGRPYAGNTDPMDHAAFQQLLDQVEENLVRMGREIFAGAIEVNPFQKRAMRACDHCEYQGICRIDPWTHSFRILGGPQEDTEAGS